MRLLAALCVLAALASCAPGDFSYSKRIAGPYRVSAIDDLTSMGLCYDMGGGSCREVVGATVFLIGWDERHVVVAQRSAPDATVRYFFVDLATDGVHGPFDLAAFESERARLSLPDFMREVPFIYGGDSPRRAKLEDILR